HLREADAAKNQFLANMSHELRTPLNGVLGFAGLLQASGLTSDQSEHLARITASGEALLGCINDMIELAELDQGEVSLDLASFDPEAMAREALATIEGAAAAKGLSLELKAGDGGRLVGDAARLGRVLGAYLSNAVKFTERGQITLELAQHAAAASQRAVLEIAVRDTGPGIGAKLRAGLFERFTPGDDSRGKSFGGGGLGLALARELIELMGGEVGVESTPGQGSRFWLRVELPRAEATGRARREEAPAAQQRTLMVLYADDNEANRLLVQTVLVSQGHRCDLANDGAAAVAAVQGGEYDVVLMDIQMPVKDGVQATVEIRALPSDIPILAVTANTLSDDRARYAEVGMNDCIAKPVNISELLAKLAYWAAAKPGATDAVAHAANS
ncbi:MAG TPA: response regulator, partial [Caulobacteraceae bacterium]|nr:response regulator [Caulobacteraceae bacterium]